MAKKEPLYPHVPKGKEAQFPHTTVKVKGGVIGELQPVPSMDRDKICEWFATQRAKVDQLVEETEYDGQEQGFSICLRPDSSLHSQLNISREFFPYYAPVNCPIGEERVGDFHTHMEDAEGRHRSFSASDYSVALTQNLQVQCLAYKWKGNNNYYCQKVYPELVRPGSPQAINVIAQHSVLAALGKAMDIEREVEDEKRQWSDYNDAVIRFEQVARTHHVVESCPERTERKE